MDASSCHFLLFKGTCNVWSYGSPYANKKQAVKQSPTDKDEEEVGSFVTAYKTRGPHAGLFSRHWTQNDLVHRLFLHSVNAKWSLGAMEAPQSTQRRGEKNQRSMRLADLVKEFWNWWL